MLPVSKATDPDCSLQFKFSVSQSVEKLDPISYGAFVL